MSQIINRRNNLFCIDEQQLSDKARNTVIINALYAAIYTEFRGAAFNKKYKDLTTKDRLQKLNEFANEWLEQRGLK